ncbi:cytochrome P450 monooxygenase aflN [Colletotrichum spaethianum]|uniref:Cytochrome P450 monooxygenase aflN n=1 Tax=Colletotrichum spaethianum TaxID=700344 RepID=A0AA37LDD9_9PEZI|nr:cytochrome P450 monooxygenase aflN [Colletotrichum spaethianum]GKT46348.1 cytochrome P450 monooxygenase aflN [Colletotrichum spaethianum]
MPPHHPVRGHLKIVSEILRELPPDFMLSAVIVHEIRIRYPYLDQAFYLDQCAFAKPILIVSSPDGARQLTQGHSLGKEPGQQMVLKPLPGGYDLDTMEGDEWKLWHNVLSPGFQVSNIAALVPSLANMANIFCNRLRQSAQRNETVWLPYTTAAIKKTLRIYPPGATSRMSNLDFHLMIDAIPLNYKDSHQARTNLMLPTEGCNVLAIRHNLPYWAQPNEFIPERWLKEDEGDALQPLANGWRPFERGPRSCTGQKMARTEIKTVCAMTATVFDIKPVYEETGHYEKYHEESVYLVSRGGTANPSGLSRVVYFSLVKER